MDDKVLPPARLSASVSPCSPQPPLPCPPVASLSGPPLVCLNIYARSTSPMLPEGSELPRCPAAPRGCGSPRRPSLAQRPGRPHLAPPHRANLKKTVDSQIMSFYLEYLSRERLEGDNLLALPLHQLPSALLTSLPESPLLIGRSDVLLLPPSLTFLVANCDDAGAPLRTPLWAAWPSPGATDTPHGHPMMCSNAFRHLGAPEGMAVLRCLCRSISL